MQVALEHVHAATHRVDMRVLEPGHQHASGEVDDLGARSDGLPDVVVVPTIEICPSVIATAWAQLRAASTVYTAPFTKTVSADAVGLTDQAS